MPNGLVAWSQGGLICSGWPRCWSPSVRASEHERVEVQSCYVVAVDDGNAYLAAGLAGMGVLWLPRYMANPHVELGELQPLFEGWHRDSMPLYLAYPRNRRVSAKLRMPLYLAYPRNRREAASVHRLDH